ncbi:MAG: DUF5658 family protein [Halobacteriales archaeon]|nr:DUF5658 family protein [Halobacteriales archaeon]
MATAAEADVESDSESHGSIDVLIRWTPWLWVAAILFFGLGDILTTVVGLSMNWAVEAGPLAATLIDSYGLTIVLALKAGAFALFYVVWRIVPSPYAVGVPLGLTVLGFEVTFWNMIVLFAAVT